MIKRLLLNELKSSISNRKAVILIGARQVGKTTLFKQIADEIETSNNSILWLNCDQQEVRNALSTTNLQELKLLIGHNNIVFIDEAQRVNDIGLTLKIIIDNMPDVKLFVTGSSAFELRNELNEPLTGRKYTYYLYPISTNEIYKTYGLIKVRELLNKRMIYGSYPAVMLSEDPAKELAELADSYLYKDILEIDGIRKSFVLEKLLIAIALQVGSEVSYNELSRTVGVDNKTIEKYINLLEKCYVIFTLKSFSRNLRSELTKSKKIYFYDNGIRNIIVNQLFPTTLRIDNGALWENFFIAERIKQNHYNGRRVNSYFWRTTDKQEIDYIEEENGEIRLYELKWNSNKKHTRLPNLFLETYHPVLSVVVTPENYTEFLCQQ